MTAVVSSVLITLIVTLCAALLLPAASVAITAKLYWLCASKSGLSIRVTSPVSASILSAGSLSAVKLKVAELSNELAIYTTWSAPEFSTTASAVVGSIVGGSISASGDRFHCSSGAIPSASS